MPIYGYKCLDCGKLVRKLLEPQEEKNSFTCPVCGATLSRNPSTVSVQGKERYDNGFQSKFTERYDDLETLTDSHARPVQLNEDFDKY